MSPLASKWESLGWLGADSFLLWLPYPRISIQRGCFGWRRLQEQSFVQLTLTEHPPPVCHTLCWAPGDPILGVTTSWGKVIS